ANVPDAFTALEGADSLAKLTAQFAGNPSYIGNPNYIGNPAYIGNPSYIGNPNYIGNPAYIGNPSYIGNPNYIGNPSYIGNPAYIGNPSYIGDEIYGAYAAAVRNSLIGWNVTEGNAAGSLPAETWTNDGFFYVHVTGKN